MILILAKINENHISFFLKIQCFLGVAFFTTLYIVFAVKQKIFVYIQYFKFLTQHKVYFIHSRAIINSVSMKSNGQPSYFVGLCSWS